ncbi:pilus assembly protein TadG-related protein [Vogesella sp. LYT5W]|uniref:Pilus assembly protein TadG-related protein n=1 Tax=Vogesella margarita TaxID=2984199 RepID=A0ABT5IRD4_9NEIS|nr:pilus assembly protein TadG-related protein [Vogesella margarita]MDC7715126.1 pilus assembly protein TadG-related protein [Vogesella margarita]
MKRTGKLPGRQYQKGAVAIIVGLCIVVLVGFLGLVADLGRLFITKTELSNAADACALAAAAELKGDAESLERAESAGITVGQRNNVNFQDNAVSILVNSDVTFSDHLAGTYFTKNAVAAASIPNMKYAKCTLPQTGIVPWFMGIMGQGAQSVTAHAVASLSPSQTNCAIPVGMCSQTPPFVSPAPTTCPDGATPDSHGFCIGKWYGSRFTAGGGFTGNFNLIDYSPPAGGASELSALLTGAGQCNLNVTTPVGQTGMQQSIAQAWNTRLGLYQGSDNVNNAPPDFTGFAYTDTSWVSQFNAYNGTSGATPNFLASRIAHTIYQGDAAAGLNLNGNPRSATAAQLAANGADRRLALMPIVNCDGWSSSQTVPIQKFACVLLLQPMQGPGDETFVEYRGQADLPGNPCATLGLPGAGGGVGPKVPALVR